MGGSIGIGPLEAVTRLLLRLDPPPAVTVVAGQDQRAAARLRALAADHPRLEVHGYTPDVASLMARADLLVTKAGGLTCSETLAVGLPMVLLRPLPGHEEDNAAHLTRLGAAIQARTPGQAAALARYLLVDAPGRRERMVQAARAAGRPRAALAVAGRVLALAGHVVLPDTVNRGAPGSDAPVPTVSLAVVSNLEHPFRSVLELARLAAVAKRRAKERRVRTSSTEREDLNDLPV